MRIEVSKKWLSAVKDTLFAMGYKFHPINQISQSQIRFSNMFIEISTRPK